MNTINFKGIESGIRYEDVYGEWLKIFKIGVEQKNIIIKNFPFTWLPLLKYFDIKYENPIEYFNTCKLYIDSENDYEKFKGENNLREYIELVSVSRPELSDALWKYDCEWKVKNRQKHNSKQFVITNNASFFRPELQNYFKILDKFKSNKKNCILLPCAADKPYPSLLHKKIIEMIPNKNWHIIIISGVTGVVPQELWNKMPYYDSGIPNEWRAMNIITEYFSRNKYDNIISYLDYYNLAFAKSILNIRNDMYKNTKIHFINPVGFYYNYINLLDKNLLKKVIKTINNIENGKL